MAQIELEAFGDQEVERIFIAANMKEARKVEAILARLELEWGVAIEAFRKAGLLFAAEYPGAAFYVRIGDAERVRQAIEEGGLRHALV